MAKYNILQSLWITHFILDPVCAQTFSKCRWKKKRFWILTINQRIIIIIICWSIVLQKHEDNRLSYGLLCSVGFFKKAKSYRNVIKLSDKRTPDAVYVCTTWYVYDI